MEGIEEVVSVEKFASISSLQSDPQVIPEEILASCNKVLFITHLAIGDFTYLQNCFSLFKQKYPHLQIDLWIDEVSRPRFWGSRKHLRNYVLVDWVKQSALFDNIYAGADSRIRLRRQMRQAKQAEYPLVVSLCTLRPTWYVRCAKKISPRGFVAAIVDKKHKSKRGFKGLGARLDIDLALDCSKLHISRIYQQWFERLFGLAFMPEDRSPFVSIPKEWISYGKLQFVKWGILPKEQRSEKAVFINVFAKNAARCWPLDRLVTLINELRQEQAFEAASFIINVEPRFYDAVKAFLSNFCLQRVFLCTANKSFFQLPALVALSDLVISVETSVVHLASALQIPVVALMRTKNPEWGPYHKDQSKIVFAPTRKSWVEDIRCQDVVTGVREFVKSGQTNL